MKREVVNGGFTAGKDNNERTSVAKDAGEREAAVDSVPVFNVRIGARNVNENTGLYNVPEAIRLPTACGVKRQDVALFEVYVRELLAITVLIMTESEAIRSSDSSPRAHSRWRFSLRTFLLTAIAIILALSHFATSWRLKQAIDENEKLRSELGYLTIDDPQKVHAIQAQTVESMLWKWRLHVPAGRNCSLHLLTRDIPEQGFPEHSTMGFTSRDEAFTLTIAIRRDHCGEWQLVASEHGGTLRMQISSETANWLAKSDGFVSRGAGIGRSESFPLDQPIELLRLRVMERKPGGFSSPPKEPCQGLLVWMKVK